MNKEKTYKKDSIGVALMRSSFPKQVNDDAMSRVISNKSAIQKSAQKIFSKNYGLFNKVGVNRDDIESILMANTYVLFSSGYKNDDGNLNRFLKQRGVKIVNIYKRAADGIAEEVAGDDVRSIIEEFNSELDDPESTYVAKETAASLIGTIEFVLVEKSTEYVEKFFKKNRTIIVRNGYSINHLLNLTRETATQYAAELYEKSEPVSMVGFKKILVPTMSRFVRSLRGNNGH